ncbi:helix-turn-helix domain-containing protein [Bifidobacterium simiarum]|uniref:helix-turn-helix domain-containing protein n=1 Tax=Bifidobacterium simiarum TaxID=2045441 RepID=UPI001BDD9051|nr:helix-turn-helix domain-containing protein [Bifidobacterium simiarum]
MPTRTGGFLCPERASATNRILGIPTSTLARWCSERRELPYVKVGRVIRYRRGDLDRWINRRTVQPLG